MAGTEQGLGRLVALKLNAVDGQATTMASGVERPSPCPISTPWGRHVIWKPRRDPLTAKPPYSMMVSRDRLLNNREQHHRTTSLPPLMFAPRPRRRAAGWRRVQVSSWPNNSSDVLASAAPDLPTEGPYKIEMYIHSEDFR